jgi:hypothetical protein
VSERIVMRTDLRDALQRRIYDTDLVLVPDADNGRTLLRFREQHIVLTVVTSAREIATFIRDADRLVPFGSGEIDAINAAAGDLERLLDPKP